MNYININACTFRVVCEETKKRLITYVNLHEAIKTANAYTEDTGNTGLILSCASHGRSGFVAFSNHVNVTIAVDGTPDEFKQACKNLQCLQDVEESTESVS